MLNHRIIKTAFGAGISVYLAQLLDINFGVTAGMVTIITIQSTKRESLKIAIERFIASAVGLFIAALLFRFIGINPLVFSLFILLFMKICLYFDLYQGFLVTVVLVTHMLVIKDVSFKIITNEIYILLLGTVVALGLNMYMPNERENLLKMKEKIDSELKMILNYFANIILTGAVSINEKLIFKRLKNDIAEYREMALRKFNNELLEECRYELDLVNMERNRYKVLNRMRSYFNGFYITNEYAQKVADFTRKVAKTVDNEELHEQIMKEFYQLREEFKGTTLPKTREEFESRAIFFQFLNGLEEFLEIKKEFLNKNDGQ